MAEASPGLCHTVAKHRAITPWWSAEYLKVSPYRYRPKHTNKDRYHTWSAKTLNWHTLVDTLRHRLPFGAFRRTSCYRERESGASACLSHQLRSSAGLVSNNTTHICIYYPTQRSANENATAFSRSHDRQNHSTRSTRLPASSELHIYLLHQRKFLRDLNFQFSFQAIRSSHNPLRSFKFLSV